MFSPEVPALHQAVAQPAHPEPRPEAARQSPLQHQRRRHHLDSIIITAVTAAAAAFIFLCVSWTIPESSRARPAPGPPASGCRSSWRSAGWAAGCRTPRRRCSAARGRWAVWRWCGPPAGRSGQRWARTGRRGWWGTSGRTGWSPAPGSCTPSTGLEWEQHTVSFFNYSCRWEFDEFSPCEPVWTSFPRVHWHKVAEITVKIGWKIQQKMGTNGKEQTMKKQKKRETKLI